MSNITNNGRSEWTIPRRTHNSAKPPQNHRMARGIQGGIRLLSLVPGGEIASSATLRR
jgi:hypothetical protein